MRNVAFTTIRDFAGTTDFSHCSDIKGEVTSCTVTALSELFRIEKDKVRGLSTSPKYNREGDIDRLDISSEFKDER